ncbi:hypothetical protein BH23ACT9_BH23ACT9_16510 [soil metagenome]
MSRATRNRPLISHDAGVKLYAPTKSYARFRLDYIDPVSGQRHQPGFDERGIAETNFNQAVQFVVAAASLAPQAGPRRHAARTVAHLFEELDQLWAEEEKAESYRQSRRTMFRLWIQPSCGDLPVLEWGTTSEFSRAVLTAARPHVGPARRQDIGALMRHMVTRTWDLGWLPLSMNPMAGVKYRARAGVQGQDRQYVEPTVRPDTENVQALIRAFQARGKRDGNWWLPVMPQVAAYGGLRFGEQVALRACDVVPGEGLWVTGSVYKGRTGPSQRKLPKNGKHRFVALPASVREGVERRAAEVKAVQGTDGLLFPSPGHPQNYWTNDSFRQYFMRGHGEDGQVAHYDGDLI